MNKVYKNDGQKVIVEVSDDVPLRTTFEELSVVATAVDREADRIRIALKAYRAFLRAVSPVKVDAGSSNIIDLQVTITYQVPDLEERRELRQALEKLGVRKW